MALEKWAVDSAAKEYWSSYFKEYGKTWVREIPRKVRKAMASTIKTANTDGVAGIVSPIGAAITEDAVYLEGMFTPPSGSALAFYAKFDHDGALSEFDTISLTASKSKPSKSKPSKSKSKSKSASK